MGPLSAGPHDKQASQASRHHPCHMGMTQALCSGRNNLADELHGKLTGCENMILERPPVSLLTSCTAGNAGLRQQQGCATRHYHAPGEFAQPFHTIILT